MQEQGGNLLRHIEGLLKTDRSVEARPLLAEYLKRYPASARGWWLLSLLLTDERQQIDCLERVLRLDPNSGLARTRLAKLRGTPEPPANPELISLFSSLKNAPAGGSPFLDPDPAPESASSIQQFINASEPEPDRRPSVPRVRPVPVKKKSTAMQIAVLVIVFCLAMAAIGVLAVVIFRQSAPPVQIPTPMAVTLPATSLSGWDLPATWTPTITLTSPPSNTPPPTDTPAPFTPISLFTFAKTPIPSYAIGPSTGLLAPGFSLKDLSDAQVSLSDYAGRPVILLFWATWCPYCEREMGSLQDIYEAYQKSGLAVLAIDCGDPAGQVRSYRNSHGLTFPVLVDAKSKTLKLYQANSFPTHFFIAPDGRITHIAVGTMTGAGLEKQVGVITRLQP